MRYALIVCRFPTAPPAVYKNEYCRPVNTSSENCCLAQGVPDGIDVVSFDAYQNGMTEPHMDRALMEKWVYPHLKPHQKVMTVPGLYGPSKVTGAAKDAVEAALIQKINGHFEVSHIHQLPFSGHCTVSSAPSAHRSA